MTKRLFDESMPLRGSQMSQHLRSSCQNMIDALEPTLCGFALSEDGMRPLHFAASSGNLSVCELLIQSLSVQISIQNSWQLIYIILRYLVICYDRYFLQKVPPNQNEEV